jgi:hypothetical protein
VIPVKAGSIFCVIGSISSRSFFKGEILPGEKSAILDRDLFDVVQTNSTSNATNDAGESAASLSRV